MAEPATVLKKIREAVSERISETAQRNAVMQTLGLYGARDVHPSETRMGRMPQGGAFRIYIWTGTPAGDFALITGPTVEAEIKKLADIEVKGQGKLRGPFVALGEVDEGFQRKVQDAGARVASRIEAGRMREVAEQVERAPAPRATRAPSKASRAPAPVEVPLEEVVVQEAPRAAHRPDFLIEWAEGYLGDAAAGLTFDTLAGLEAALKVMAEFAPDGGTYDKVKVQVTKPDGKRTYTRVDLTQEMNTPGYPYMADAEKSWRPWLEELGAERMTGRDRGTVQNLEDEAARARKELKKVRRTALKDSDLHHALEPLRERAQALLDTLKRPPADKSPDAWTGASLQLVMARQKLQEQYAPLLDPDSSDFDAYSAGVIREVNDLIDRAAQRAAAFATLVDEAANFPSVVENIARGFMASEEQHQAEEPVTSWADEVERLQAVVQQFERKVFPGVRGDADVLVQRAKTFGLNWRDLAVQAENQLRMWGLAPLLKLLREAEAEAAKEAARTAAEPRYGSTFKAKAKATASSFDTSPRGYVAALPGGTFQAMWDGMPVSKETNLDSAALVAWKAYKDARLPMKDPEDVPVWVSRASAWSEVRSYRKIQTEAKGKDDAALLRRTTMNYLKEAQDLTATSYNVGQMAMSDLPDLQKRANDLLEGVRKWQALLDERATDPEDRRELGRKAQEAANMALNAKVRIDEAVALRKTARAEPAPAAAPAPDTSEAAKMAAFVAAMKAALAED